MAVTVLFGWWTLPFGATIAAFLWAWVLSDKSPSSDYGNIGKALGNLILYGVAIIFSLIAWLIWAVLT